MFQKIGRIFGIAILFAAVLTVAARWYAIRELLFFLAGLSALFLVAMFVIGMGLSLWMFGRIAARWVKATRSNAVIQIGFQSNQFRPRVSALEGLADSQAERVAVPALGEIETKIDMIFLA